MGYCELRAIGSAISIGTINKSITNASRMCRECVANARTYAASPFRTSIWNQGASEGNVVAEHGHGQLRHEGGNIPRGGHLQDTTAMTVKVMAMMAVIVGGGDGGGGDDGGGDSVDGSGDEDKNDDNNDDDDDRYDVKKKQEQKEHDQKHDLLHVRTPNDNVSHRL